MQALKQEWAYRFALLPKKGPLTIYFGGGTPSLLGPDKIGEILSWISVSKGVEITLEANPETVSYELMKAYREVGINRISLGVQSFDDSLLAQLSRTHRASDAIQAIDAIERAQIHNLSIDLMYDLPGQSLASWEASLNQAVLLPITHLSLYNLTIEPHTVFYKKRETITSQMPDPITSFEMITSAVNILETNGFKRYEISAFARDNLYSRHNLGYWAERPFLGFGPSAFSFWGGSRFRNIAHLNRYCKALASGNDPVDFSETLSYKESLKEQLAVGLRLIEGVPIQNWPAEIQLGIDRLQHEGWVENKDGHICLTAKGILFHDTVAEKIMEF